MLPSPGVTSGNSDDVADNRIIRGQLRSIALASVIVVLDKSMKDGGASLSFAITSNLRRSACIRRDVISTDHIFTSGSS